MALADVESLERATVAGVAPAEVLEIDGWLVPLDTGTIGRAKSATPLRHDVGPAALDAIEAAYRSRGLPPAFRIADKAGLAKVRAELERRGRLAAKPTVVKVASAQVLAQFSDAPVELLARPDEGWGAVFLGEGFDPADGASRVAALSRAPDALYAAVRDAGRTVAVGVVTFGHGWAGIHGMRTARHQRGRGHAGGILAAFGRAAAARGIGRVFLQVEAGNPAGPLYRKAGFSEAWTYRYWG